MYHDFIKSRISFWNSYFVCPFPSSMSILRLWLGFLVGILGLVRFPVLLFLVTDQLVRMAGGVFCCTKLSPWSVVFYAVATWVVVCLWFLCHLLAHSQHLRSSCFWFFIASSFLIRSVSLRAHTIWNWMCLSSSTSVGKLDQSANPCIHSTSLSGV